MTPHARILVVEDDPCALLLISHILFAAISLPFILFTFIAGWTNRFTVHRKLARWVFPLWFYVALTGPVCYLMLRPYYG